MTRKQRRLWAIVGGLVLLGAATALVLNAFSDNLVFFVSPSELAQKHVAAGRRIRIGGLVEEGSIRREDGGTKIHFRVTDRVNSVDVVYTGLLPDLFREGQGVVAEGRLDQGGVFVASEVLAKHDEKYMPPEVVEALKKAGQWRNPDASQ